jgi:CrcB protein
VLGTGFLGGYTTFSTASVEAARLLRAGEGVRAAVQAGGMLVLSVAASWLGLALGRL